MKVISRIWELEESSEKYNVTGRQLVSASSTQNQRSNAPVAAHGGDLIDYYAGPGDVDFDSEGNSIFNIEVLLSDAAVIGNVENPHTRFIGFTKRYKYVAHVQPTTFERHGHVGWRRSCLGVWVRVVKGYYVSAAVACLDHYRGLLLCVHQVACSFGIGSIRYAIEVLRCVVDSDNDSAALVGVIIPRVGDDFVTVPPIQFQQFRPPIRACQYLLGVSQRSSPTIRCSGVFRKFTLRLKPTSIFTYSSQWPLIPHAIIMGFRRSYSRPERVNVLGSNAVLGDRPTTEGKEARDVIMYRACPRCSTGALIVDRDYYSWNASCLQCGFVKDVDDVSHALELFGRNGRRKVLAKIPA